MDKKLGLFTQEDMKHIQVNVKKESECVVAASKVAAAGLAAPCWVVGGAGLAASAAA